jgi:type I thyroxine 5'-deiodinase
LAEVQKIREDFLDQVELVLVYIKEAHSGDEWQMDSNVESKVVFDQPKTFEARTDLARTFVDRMGVETETLVDDIRNTAMACYAAWPERIYVIDRDGRIVYKGGVGPFYFAPDELREFLQTMRQASG